MSVCESSEGGLAARPGSRPLGRWASVDEARARLGSRVTLVVEPDVEASGRIFLSLGQVGAKVRLARRFEQALHLLTEVRPDLVLLATRVNEGDSLALVGQLRALPTAPQVVAIAPQSSRAERKRFLAAGCAAYLCKPIDVHLFALELTQELLKCGHQDAADELPAVAPGSDR